ncbi:retrovirus-related pol polyprotein from transposon TNT 1-94 [Tanacetum coccineum]
MLPSSNSKTSHVNAVCAECGKCVFNSNHDACVSRYLNDVNARTRKPKVYRFVEEMINLLQFLGHGDLSKEMSRSKRDLFTSEEAFSNDLLTGNRGSDLYTISLQETTSSTPICFMAKASPTQAWLWHRRLSHLNFDYITLLSKKDVVTGLPKLKYVKDQLCSSCEMSKAKRSSFKTKAVPSSKGRLNLLHMDLCGPMRDETPEFLKRISHDSTTHLKLKLFTVYGQRHMFLNKTLHAYFKEEGIEHQTSTPRTPKQNGVVERRNRTLVEAARTMLSASKLPFIIFGLKQVATGLL